MIATISVVVHLPSEKYFSASRNGSSAFCLSFLAATLKLLLTVLSNSDLDVSEDDLDDDDMLGPSFASATLKTWWS